MLSVPSRSPKTANELRRVELAAVSVPQKVQVPAEGTQVAEDGVPKHGFN